MDYSEIIFMVLKSLRSCVFRLMLNRSAFKCNHTRIYMFAQSAGAVEYIDCTSAEG